MNPDEFAKILTEKLQRVLVEQQMQEREATNLSQSLEVNKQTLNLCLLLYIFFYLFIMSEFYL